MRIKRAVQLIETGEYSMTQIAALTGFSNASRFAIGFRKYFGCNPGEYNSLKSQD